MSEKAVCDRCGRAAPMDARYCPSCGAALVPPSASPARRMGRILITLSRPHMGLLGFVILIPTSVFAAHLIVVELTFRPSIVVLALVLGCGCAYAGWEWNTSLPMDRRIVRMLVLLACMWVLLAITWLVDRTWLSLVSASGGSAVYAIPGVYVEASLEGRRLVIVDVPPYWLALIAYGVVTGAVGDLVHRLQGSWTRTDRLATR